MNILFIKSQKCSKEINTFKLFLKRYNKRNLFKIVKK